MTEIEKISIAKAYVEKLANGINPLTGKAVPDSDTINDIKISRCLFMFRICCDRWWRMVEYPHTKASA